MLEFPEGGCGMFRGFVGPYCCAMDANATGFSWRVFNAKNEKAVVAQGEAASDREAISQAYSAIERLRIPSPDPLGY